MDKRKLGQLEVSPIGMGCMGFSHGYGQVPPEAYAIEAIRGAYDYGCTHFDTAEAYGKEQFYAGHNEELVGKAIEPFRKKVVLATNFVRIISTCITCTVSVRQSGLRMWQPSWDGLFRKD